VAKRLTTATTFGRKMLKTKAEAKTMRFLVYTSIGKPKTITPEKSVLSAVIEAVEEDSASA